MRPVVDCVVPGNGVMTSARDAAAYKVIYDTRSARLVRTRARAEHWIAGLSALVAVLTTAMVVKGPENFAQADGSVRVVVLVLVVAGVVGLGTGLVCAYSAAFGGLWKPGEVDRLVENPPTVAADAAARLEFAASADTRSAQRSMRTAGAATIAAMVCLLAAVGFAWFATPATKVASTSCVATIDGVVAVSGPVVVRSGTALLVPCE